MTDRNGVDGRDPAGSRADRADHLRGRRPGDRRIRVARNTSPYFRYGAPGVMTAKAAAIAPTQRADRAATVARRWLFGRPIATDQEHGERLSKLKALAVFSSDMLSSVAYATEAAMFTLLGAGTATFGLTVPISALICLILWTIVISYRQTIRAYPNGGGSYIVAKANLGTLAGLIAAAALLTDYVLTVSVSVAAGIVAIISAFPELADLRLVLCASAIGLVAVVNLRGVRESGTVFAIPTYIFVVATLALIGVGVMRTLLGVAPHVTDVALARVPLESLSVLLVMRAFADGCSAITGVEAVSNGVPAFRPPESLNARTTMTIMGALVATMFLGISFLAGVTGAAPALSGESVVSQIARATFGGGPLYYILQFSTTGILILAANTSFADFPRLSSILARDGFMPSRFAFRGERLAFSTGIVALAVLAIVVLLAFGGRVEALIPLYAIGVFTSITLSQVGMVRHWRKERGPGWRRSTLINGFGAVATALVTVIFAIAKFALGAWLIILIVPILVVAMLFVHRQYERRRVETHVRPELTFGRPHRHQRVVVPVPDVTRDVIQAIRFGLTMSDHVTAVHVTDDMDRGEELRARFARQLPGIPLTIIESPYRALVRPLIRFLEYTAEQVPDEVVIVLLPEYVPRHWWERFLYNENTRRIRSGLLGRPNLLVAEVPFRREL
ncbi:MAG TPA: APC family permease [Candidatus Limnocylindrales bacterium]